MLLNLLLSMITSYVNDIKCAKIWLYNYRWEFNLVDKFIRKNCLITPLIIKLLYRLTITSDFIF